MVGQEWLVEAQGCDPELLRSAAAVTGFFDEVVRVAELTPVGACQLHVFPAPGGITAMLMLSESHLTIHTFPEFALATVNLYCCRVRPGLDWAAILRAALHATTVQVVCCPRGGSL